MDPVEKRPAFLVEVTSSPPDRPTRTVSLSVVPADPRGAMPDLPEPGQVASMRSEAAHHGANFLLIERLDTRWRRVFYGVGLKLDPNGDTAPHGCGMEEAAPALGKVKKKAKQCIASLRTSRPRLRATINATLHIDPFGRLKAIQHADDSSRDSMVRNCMTKPAARMSFGAHRGYSCTIPLTLTVE